MCHFGFVLRNGLFYIRNECCFRWLFHPLSANFCPCLHTNGLQPSLYPYTLHRSAYSPVPRVASLCSQALNRTRHSSWQLIPTKSHNLPTILLRCGICPYNLPRYPIHSPLCSYLVSNPGNSPDILFKESTLRHRTQQLFRTLLPTIQLKNLCLCW